jgi:hypothetical protein
MEFEDKSLSELIELMIEAHKDVKEKERDLHAAKNVISLKDDVPESASYVPLQEQKLQDATENYEEIKGEIDRREKLYEK